MPFYFLIRKNYMFDNEAGRLKLMKIEQMKGD